MRIKRNTLEHLLATAIRIEASLKRLQEIERKLDRLEQFEMGTIPAHVSNDPTELETWESFPKRRLHSWTLKPGDTDETITQCFACGVLLENCGATEESWYCD